MARRDEFGKTQCLQFRFNTFHTSTRQETAAQATDRRLRELTSVDRRVLKKIMDKQEDPKGPSIDERTARLACHFQAGLAIVARMLVLLVWR